MATKENTQTALKTRTAQALGRALIRDWYAGVKDRKVRAALRKAMTRQIESSLGEHNLHALRALAVASK